MQTSSQMPSMFDAIVVGSGATGGWAAKELAEAGLKVAMVEAGPMVRESDFSEHDQPYDWKYRGSTSPKSPDVMRNRPTQGRCYAVREGNYKWFVDDAKNPYTTPKDKPFWWIRERVVGGRSLSWGRQSYRMGDIDFKGASRDGYGIDWPISHADLDKYYEKVERFIGISGLEEGLSQLPDSVFLPPMKFSCGEALFRTRLKERMNRTLTMGRTAILTENHNGRAACHYCGPCEQGCITHSYYSSPFTTMKAAEATGNFTLLTDAVVSRVLKNANTGLASGVTYIDRTSREEREVHAKTVVLCASTLESTRILLNSEPGGMANSSGTLGHYLMDHIYQGGASGKLPELPAEPWEGMPRRPTGIYIPRFRNVDRTHTNGMIRGYGFQGRSGANFARGAKGFGAAYKQAVHDDAEWSTGITAWCETLPRYDNHVRLHPTKTDAWGIPILDINVAWGSNELALWNDSRNQAAEMLETTGHTDVKLTGQVSVPGFCIHEVGTARMSADPKQGVLNGFAQSHDIKNLFVTDGAAWTSIACQNPTLTMMAITARTCDFIQDQLGKGELG